MRIVCWGCLAILFCAFAKADIIDTFSFSGTLDVAGTITGTIDLPFVNPGGSGTGAASSIVITSFPSGLGTFSAGLTVTNWALQEVNTFTVSSGTITSFDFFALSDVTTSANLFCLNSTTTVTPAPSVYACPADLNLLESSQIVYTQNLLGASGVTFSPASSAPEPASIWLGESGLGCCVLLALRRRFPKTRA